RRKHMKLQSARCTACLDLLDQALEMHAAPLKFGHELHQVMQTAPESIKSPHHEGIPGPQRLEATLKLRAYPVLADGYLLVNPAAPSLLERIALQVQVVLAHRNAGISDTPIH